MFAAAWSGWRAADVVEVSKLWADWNGGEFCELGELVASTVAHEPSRHYSSLCCDRCRTRVETVCAVGSRVGTVAWAIRGVAATACGTAGG